MSSLTKAVINDTLEKCQVHYLDRSTARWWNERRAKGQPPVFCGWYWVKGPREAGPFKTQSSAMRDAYFTLVLNEHVPQVFNRRTNRERQASHHGESKPSIR